SSYIRATRAGVSRRPPRSGSSPTPRRIMRTPSSIAAASNRSFTGAMLPEAGSADARVQLQVEMLHRRPNRRDHRLGGRWATARDDGRDGVRPGREAHPIRPVGSGRRLVLVAVRRGRPHRPGPDARWAWRPDLLHRTGWTDRHAPFEATGWRLRRRR